MFSHAPAKTKQKLNEIAENLANICFYDLPNHIPTQKLKSKACKFK